MSKQSSAEKRALSASARLYAVQALFQMEALDQSASRVRREFEDHRIAHVDKEGTSFDADQDLFGSIVDNAVTYQVKIDQATDRALVERWKIDRIDPVLRALLRAAGAELVVEATPPRVVITEYVALADAFFPEGREVKLINALLDHMARGFQPDAFK